tara:strand:- start:483 stop:1301 length:819 start_codon:yes stop_codon:yes gene_type:complete
MANRFPLIVDSSALQIKEIPSGDNLDLANSSIVNVVDITASGNVTIGGTLTYEDVQNIDSLGIVTARTGIRVLAGGAVIAGATTATNGIRVGAGQSIGSDGADVVYYGDGSNLSGVIAGVGINTAGGNVGYGVTLLDFRGAGVSTITAPSSGISTINITGGGGGGGSISTEAATVTNAVTTLDLTAAQDHKLTVTGIVTVTCSGGTEGESHTVRVINSGIATVGFSTYFLFPSGAAPVMPTGSGEISLISFTVNRVGTAGTQLLAGASLNLS